jgi:hypothetical protein
VWTITGTAFYKLIFSQIYNDGQCYAFSVLSAELFGNSPPRQPYLDGNAFEPASLLGSLGGTGNIWDALSRTESTLLGAGGALDAADAYYDSAVDVDGNAGIFQDIAKGVMSGPVVLGLAPIPTLSALLQYGGDMHTVVAYDTGIDGGTAPQDQTVPNDPYVGDPQIEIYNPNDPATGPPQEPNESNYPDFIDLTPDGGIWMPFSIFIGDSAYGMGPPADWLLVPLPSDTWTSASNDQWVGADVPLAVLEGINNGVWSLGPGVPFFLPGGEAGSGGQGHAPLVMKLPRGKGFAGSVTAGGGRETVTQLVGNRVAIATRESSPRGSTSGVRIDADASSLHVAAGRGTERFDLTLGHDLSASYGREVELAGLSLAPKASVTLSSDSSARTFTLTSSLRSGDIGVVASLTQVGRNAGTASAVVQLPAGEAKATVRVDNWNALASRPIYESITQDGKTHVFELASFLVTRATWGRDRLKLTIAKLPKGDRLRITLYYTHGRRRTLTTAKAASTITTARPTRLVLRAYRRNHQQGASVTVTKLPSNERQR